MKHFESFLAPQLQQYAAYRQVLGYAKKCINPSSTKLWSKSAKIAILRL
jgi:hypothetical protein